MPAQSASIERLAGVFANPAAALLLWGLVVTGKLDAGLLAVVGLKDVDVELVERTFERQLCQLRLMDFGGILPAERLASLARGLVGSKLTQAALGSDLKAQELALRSFSRLPVWVRDEECAKLEREARLEMARLRIEEVNLRRAESRAMAARRAVALNAKELAVSSQSPGGKSAEASELAACPAGYVALDGGPPECVERTQLESGTPPAEAQRQQAMSGSVPGAKVKKTAMQHSKTQFSGSFPTAQVKSTAPEAFATAAPNEPAEPQEQPLSQHQTPPQTPLLTPIQTSSGAGPPEPVARRKPSAAAKRAMRLGRR